jgi:Zn-finger nucleic acid-binding protein
MDCPRGHGQLIVERHGGIEVDRCETCSGRWLDANELDELEATAAGEESRRGMIEYSKRDSEIACPKCGKRMTAFNYRANNLELDSCPDDHGYWLDAGETDRVVDLIEQRVRDLNRAASAEASWGGFVQKLRGDRKGGRFRR